MAKATTKSHLPVPREPGILLAPRSGRLSKTVCLTGSRVLGAGLHLSQLSHFGVHLRAQDRVSIYEVDTSTLERFRMDLHVSIATYYRFLAL